MDKKDRVGIITILPDNNNYGGILQGLALQNVLKENGIEGVLIQRIRTRISNFGKIKQFLKKIVQGERPTNKSIGKALDRFVREKFNPVTDRIDNNKDMFTLVHKYNLSCVLVGSDQVWRKAYNKDRKSNFFLDFVPDEARKVAYASSFGIDSWDYTWKETQEYKKLIKRFSYVSVREDSGVILCKEHFDVDAELVLDPTLLMSRDFYESLGACEDTEYENGILVYLIGEETDAISHMVDDISKMLDFSQFYIGKTKYNKEYPSVESWINGFKKAKFVITDSYHGFIFSLIFNVPFLIIGNRNTGLARYSSLLKVIGLENRLILENYEESMEIVSEDINWEDVNEIIGSQRIKSIKFLLNSIKND